MTMKSTSCKYPGIDKPRKKDTPTMNKFLIKSMFMNCKTSNPTEAAKIKIKITKQNINLHFCVLFINFKPAKMLTDNQIAHNMQQQRSGKVSMQTKLQISL
ncbi:hypothetical protein R6Q59_017186 [Mikania micrantha]